MFGVVLVLAAVAVTMGGGCGGVAGVSGDGSGGWVVVAVVVAAVLMMRCNVGDEYVDEFWW